METIREKAITTKIIEEGADTEPLHKQEYTEQDVDIELMNMANRNANGNDGVPGGAYKETGKWEIMQIMKIANHIKMGHQYMKTGLTVR